MNNNFLNENDTKEIERMQKEYEQMHAASNEPQDPMIPVGIKVFDFFVNLFYILLCMGIFICGYEMFHGSGQPIRDHSGRHLRPVIILAYAPFTPFMSNFLKNRYLRQLFSTLLLALAFWILSFFLDLYPTLRISWMITYFLLGYAYLLTLVSCFVPPVYRWLDQYPPNQWLSPGWDHSRNGKS